MLRGATPRAAEMVGTAVLRMVVSRDSMKNATATSHGRMCLPATDGLCGGAAGRCDVAGVVGSEDVLQGLKDVAKSRRLRGYFWTWALGSARVDFA